jgi:hypothetical protein
LQAFKELSNTFGEDFLMGASHTEDILGSSVVLGNAYKVSDLSSVATLIPKNGAKLQVSFDR